MEWSLVYCIVCIHCILAVPNYTYYEITAFNVRERHILHNIHETLPNVFFLNGVTNEASTSMNVVVNSCCLKEFESLLEKYGIQYTIFASNITLPKNKKRTHTTPDVSKKFLDWDRILLWVKKKVNLNSALKTIVIAKTYEQRDIFVLKLSTAVDEKKMAIFIVAGEEGRDWLSSALLLTYINKILDSVNSPESLLNYYEFYFIPIFNPDGFVYSKKKERFWAKNRKELQPSKLCSGDNAAVGVNIDRNWFYNTGKNRGKKSEPIIVSTSNLNIAEQDSINAICNSIYIGNRPLSEEETRALSYILNKIALNLLAFVNLRGFGKLIALPYSDRNEISNNHYVVLEIMKHVSSMIKKQYNTSYPVGTTENYYYNFSGNMADWVKKNLNIPIVLTLYMKRGKFLPHEGHILPLSNQLDLLLNVTLNISKDIYGSLYSIGKKKTYALILLVINCISWI